MPKGNSNHQGLPNNVMPVAVPILKYFERGWKGASHHCPHIVNNKQNSSAWPSDLKRAGKQRLWLAASLWGSSSHWFGGCVLGGLWREALAADGNRLVLGIDTDLKLFPLNLTRDLLISRRGLIDIRLYPPIKGRLLWVDLRPSHALPHSLLKLSSTYWWSQLLTGK
jgi:hypothetical protein